MTVGTVLSFPGGVTRMHKLSRLRFLRKNAAARPERSEWPRVMSLNMHDEAFPPEIEKRDSYASRQDPQE